MIYCFLKVILHIFPSICIKCYTNIHSTCTKKVVHLHVGLFPLRHSYNWQYASNISLQAFFFLLKCTIKRLHHPRAGGQTTILGDCISKLLSYKGRPIYSNIDLNHRRAICHDSTTAARYIWVMICLSCVLRSASSYLKSSLQKVDYYSDSAP